MPLEQISGLGIGIEITLQRPGFPSDGARGLRRHPIHFRRRAAQEKRGAHDVPCSQVAEHLSICCQLHLSPNDERHGFDRLAVLNQSLARGRRHPRPDAENLQDLLGRQIPEDQPANLLLLRRQPDRTAFDEQTPRLKGVDSGKQDAPSKRRPQRRRLQQKIGDCRERGCHREKAKPQNVPNAVRPQQQDVGGVNEIIRIERVHAHFSWTAAPENSW